jgi:hypothetical protein
VKEVNKESKRFFYSKEHCKLKQIIVKKQRETYASRELKESEIMKRQERKPGWRIWNKEGFIWRHSRPKTEKDLKNLKRP